MAEADDTGSGSGGGVNAPDHSSGSERAEQFATGVGAALEGRLGEQREAHFELEGEGSDQAIMMSGRMISGIPAAYRKPSLS